MMPLAARELRDPYAWALAVLAVVANLALHASPLEAVAVALVLLLVKVVAGIFWPRPPAAPKPTLAAGAAAAQLDPAPATKLTARELEVASWVPRGLSNKEIGKKLVPHVKERGVDKHIANIMDKLDVHTRAEIAAWYERHIGSSRST